MNVIQNFVWGRVVKYEETIIEITTTQPNQTFEWKNVQGNVIAYDWDNGIVNKSNTHTFQGAGTYTIKIIGSIYYFRANNPLVTKIIKVASTIRDFSWTFYNCTNLSSIPTGLFDKNVNVTSFSGCFSYCSNLTNRPKPHNLEMWQIAGTNGRPTNINISNMFRNCISMPDYNNLPNSVK